MLMFLGSERLSLWVGSFGGGGFPENDRLGGLSGSASKLACILQGVILLTLRIAFCKVFF